MTTNGAITPAEQAYQALTRMRESFEAFLKESSLRIKDLDQGTRLVEEVFKGAAGNVVQRKIQIKDQKQEIERLEKSISETKSKVKELEVFVEDLTKAIRKQNEIVENQKEIINKEQIRGEQLEETTKTKRGEVSSLENEISALKEDLDSVRIQGDKTLALMRDSIVALEGEIKQLKQENGVIDFLITESSVEIPEVDILTAVFSSDSSVSLDSLKQNMGVAPVTVSRTVQKLEAKGIIAFSSTDNKIVLKK
ncbi:MAG: hypothetical protein ACFFD4_30400 [Candidatus Odinarchaeota archaeon]